MRFLDSGGMGPAAPERLATMLGPSAERPSRGFGGDPVGGDDPPSLRPSPAPPGHLRSERLGRPPGEPSGAFHSGPAAGLDEQEPPQPPERWRVLRQVRAFRRLLESGRMDPGPPGARALAVTGMVAAVVAGGFLWLSRPRPEPVPAAAAAASLAVPAAASSRAPGSVPPVAGSSQILVHVAGRVRRPGVVTLPAGARVTDAIKAAGGVRHGTGTGALNLARKVIDGEQILVGVSGAPGGAAPPGGSQPAGGAQAADPEAPLDLNAATSEQFQRLPGVGPVLAQRIIDFRTQQGGFRAVEDLRQVTGIGARRFAELKDLVRV